MRNKSQTFYPTNSFPSALVILIRIIYITPVLFFSFIRYLLTHSFFPLKIPVIRPAEYTLPIIIIIIIIIREIGFFECLVFLSKLS